MLRCARAWWRAPQGEERVSRPARPLFTFSHLGRCPSSNKSRLQPSRGTFHCSIRLQRSRSPARLWPWPRRGKLRRTRLLDRLPTSRLLSFLPEHAIPSVSTTAVSCLFRCPKVLCLQPTPRESVFLVRASLPRAPPVNGVPAEYRRRARGRRAGNGNRGTG